MSSVSTARPARRLWTRFWVPLFLVLTAFGVVGTVTVLHSDAMSPVDEWVYLDYLDKLPTQGLVNQGEQIGPRALERMACDGVVLYGKQGPPCGSSYSNPSEFPFEGVTSADIYVPIYFVVTRAFGDLIELFSGADQLVSWRLTGALWLGAAMVPFVALLRMWKVSNLSIVALGLLVIASPFVWWSNTYVSTDAPALLVGSVLFLATEKYLRGQWSWWWVPLLSVLAVAVKFTFIVAVCAVALYMLIHWISEWIRSLPSTPDRRFRSFAWPQSWAVLATALVTLASSITGYAIWNAVRASMSVGSPAHQGNLRPMTKIDLIQQLANFLPGAISKNPHFEGGYALDLPSFLVGPFAWVTIAGVIGAIFIFTAADREYPLVLSVGLASMVAAPILAVAVYLSAGAYFTLPPRYGGPLLPAFLLMAALILRSAVARFAVLGYALVMIGVLVTGAGLAAASS